MLENDVTSEYTKLLKLLWSEFSEKSKFTKDMCDINQKTAVNTQQEISQPFSLLISWDWRENTEYALF